MQDKTVIHLVDRNDDFFRIADKGDRFEVRITGGHTKNSGSRTAEFDSCDLEEIARHIIDHLADRAHRPTPEEPPVTRGEPPF